MEKKYLPKIRIIPKLEIKNTDLIKGVKFEGLRKVGDPILFAEKYYKDGADQINIIDIVASLYSRDNIYEIVNKITDNIFIPVNVGGGIRDIDHIEKLLNVGADRIIINSEALRNPKFLLDVKKIFGEQFVSISIEAKKIKNKFFCMMDHGRENSGIEVINWVKKINEIGVCEIILNSIDNDGMENGFDKDLLNECYRIINCPLVISGGVSNLDQFCDLINNYNLDGISSSSCFHFNKLNISELKKYLDNKNFSVNI